MPKCLTSLIPPPVLHMRCRHGNSHMLKQCPNLEMTDITDTAAMVTAPHAETVPKLEAVLFFLQKSTCWWRYNRPMWKGWHLFLDLVGMCVQSFTEIASCVHDLRHFVQNWPILQTLEANLSQSGWNMEYQTDLSWSHDYRDTVYQFAWFLDGQTGRCKT